MSDDNSFFGELQADFLNEASFMLEQYEESMIKLETSTDPEIDLTDIFRVAHSVKGGAAAVGLMDLAKFAHVIEDLLDFLRTFPELVNPTAISLLLESGDELKNRILALLGGDNGDWDTSALRKQLIEQTEKLTETAAKAGLKSRNIYKPSPTLKFEAKKLEAAQEASASPSPSPITTPIATPSAAPVAPSSNLDDDDVNHELMAELLAQMPEDERADYLAQEKAENEKALALANSKLESNSSSVSGKSASANENANALKTATLSENKDTHPDPIAQMKTQAHAHAFSHEEAGPAHHPDLKISESARTSSETSNLPGKSEHKAIVKGSEAGSAQNGAGAVSAKQSHKNIASVIKVDTGRVDSVLDAVGELVVLKNQLIHDETVRNGSNLRLEGIVDQLDKAVRELYEKTLSIRMTPLKSMFVKIQRIVRDVSLNLGKPVDLQLIGEETEVERTVFELLGDPLVHLVRNSMDHGIEKKETRAERNKPAIAKVVVSAKQSGGNVIIEIIDDGGGINREKVLNKAIERGLVQHGIDPTTLSDENVFQFIFQPGFSTADKISDLSGRGVGLDVVKSNLDKINGKINIFSKSGQGTTFRLTIPLSTAITDGIIVSLDGARYILPIHSIREIVRVVPKDYTHVSNVGRVASVRGNLLPVVDVSKTLGHISADLNKSDRDKATRRENSLSARRGETMLVIIEAMTGQMAFLVDDILGQAQVVVKPISTGHDIPEVSGAAILGDGRTVLILEPGALITQATRNVEMSA